MIRRRETGGGLLFDDRFRVLLLALLILLGALILLCRSYLLQIHYGEIHREKISRQSVRRIRIPARRGKIFTSDLLLLAGNRSICNLVFYPEEMRFRSRKKTVEYMLECIRQLEKAVQRTSDAGEKQLLRHLKISPGLPFTVFRDLSPAECARALECARKLRGVDLQPEQLRCYPQGDMAPHIIGYARQQDVSGAEDRKEFFYYLPDLVGKGGVEEAFDTLPPGSAGTGLRGSPGYSLVQVDNVGYVHRELIKRIEPRHGSSAVLTIDSRAQKIAEDLLSGSTGAIVVLNADNGDVLCAATSPRYDLGKFFPRLSPEYFSRLLRNPRKPLLNRPFQGTYQPGSILKPLVSLAYLRSGVDPEAKTLCDGGTDIHGVRIRCSSYRRGGHGELDMVHALGESCNDYMIEHARHCPLSLITHVLRSARIGRKTGLELPEAAGVFPSDAYKKRHYRTRWNLYDTALLSIGQGIISLTPLQAACFTAAIANGGTMWKPHIVERMVGPFGNTIYERRPENMGKLDASPQELEIIRRGMEAVVEGGSGRRGAVEGLKLFGKTGSAEVGPVSARRLMTWFIAWTRHQERTYAMAVLVEDGLSGGTTCAPLAAEFFSRFLAIAPVQEKENPELEPEEPPQL